MTVFGLVFHIQIYEWPYKMDKSPLKSLGAAGMPSAHLLSVSLAEIL